MKCALILDGHNEAGFIAGDETCPDIRFHYRAILAEEWDQMIDWAGRLEPKAAAQKQNELIASHLIEWDIQLPGGKAAEATTENVRRLPTTRRQRLRDIMTKHVKGDTDPRVKDEPQDAGTDVKN